MLETFNFSRVQKVTSDSAACGLEGLINLQLGAVSPFRSVSARACGSWLDATCLRLLGRVGWLETFNFSRVQKVTLDSAACRLEGLIKPSAGC